MTIEEAGAMVLTLLQDRARGATVCPSEVARRLAGDEAPDNGQTWRGMMPIVHEAVDRLLREERVGLSWKGRKLVARSGPYRITRPL